MNRLLRIFLITIFNIMSALNFSAFDLRQSVSLCSKADILFVTDKGWNDGTMKQLRRNEISIISPLDVMTNAFYPAECNVIFWSNASSHLIQKIVERLHLKTIIIHTPKLASYDFANTLKLNSNVFIVCDGNIFEIYNRRGVIIQQKIDTERNIETVVVRRGNFHQMNVFGTAQGGHKPLDGSVAKWIEDLQKTLNFNLHVIRSNKTAALTGDGGPFDYLLGSEIADVSLGMSALIEFRAKYLKFLQPSFAFNIYAFFQQPPPNSIGNFVTTPFTPTLWVMLISLWMFVILVVKLMSNCLSKKIDTEFLNSLGIWGIGANCQKSGNIVPDSNYLRIVFVVGLLSGFLIYTAYSAKITSVLAVVLVPVQQFMDLVSYKFTFTVFHSSQPLKEFLQFQINLHNLPQKVCTVKTAEEQISHLVNQKNAHIGYEDFFYGTAKSLNYSDAFICKHMSKIKISEFRYKSAFIVKKESELTEFFNHRIIGIIERGFNDRYSKAYGRKTILACDSWDPEPSPIELMDTATSFFVIISGFFGALVGLCF